MDCVDAINKRMSVRDFSPAIISDAIIHELARAASLAPSCYNKQPWRFVFVKSKEGLEKLLTTVSEGNKWVSKASMIIAVYSKREFDCFDQQREYYLFDTGMAVGFLILRATELGLATHIIAGFDHEKAKTVLSIPKDTNLIALIAVGGLPSTTGVKSRKRPERKAFEEFARIA